MKKKTVKKIAHAYLRGRYWCGVGAPEWWPIDTDGHGHYEAEANLPNAVKRYLCKTGNYIKTRFILNGDEV